MLTHLHLAFSRYNASTECKAYPGSNGVIKLLACQMLMLERPLHTHWIMLRHEHTALPLVVVDSGDMQISRNAWEAKVVDKPIMKLQMRQHITKQHIF